MYNNARIIIFIECVVLLLFVLFVVKLEFLKSNLKLDFSESIKHEMNNSVFNHFRRIAKKPYSCNFINLKTFNKNIFGRFTSAYRITKYSPIPHSLFTSSHNYTTNNYNKFLNLSNSNVYEMDATIPLELDVYRNDVDKTGRAILKITEPEKRLFDLLTECVKFYALDMDLRVVGGWVRDKLLEKENKDIDVAIPKMTGLEFCDYLNKFTNEKFGFARTVGVVKRCPEQSKHLETATMNLLGFDVDFVNLRSEDYTSESRIPVMRIGTPFEDSLRRDFTVNSLFFNISKNLIEDFTGTGLNDLRTGLIRTCSSPFETLMDDPLRAVRAVRFSSRLNFKLDQKLVESINDQVLEALENKVSRSRISQEIDNILAKGDISEAFDQMYQFRILHVLLNVPYKGQNKTDPVSGVTDKMLSDSVSLMKKFKGLNFPDIEYKYLFLSALLAPTRELPRVGKIEISDYLIKDRLKLPNKYSTSANTISEGSLKFCELLNTSKDDRVSLGLVIRSVGPLWKEALLMCIAETNRDYRVFREVVDRANSLGITEAYNLKAPITGPELTEVLPNISSGPKFKRALEFQIKEILTNEKVQKEELKEKLRLQFKEFL